MLEKGINSPITASAGRLFDAVAAIAGLRQQANFEGQAAMELEFAMQPAINEAYPFEVQQNTESIVDWQPMILAIVKDVQREQAIGMISTKFHNTLAEIIVDIARTIGEQKIVLTGGCFQNKYLTECAVRRLTDEGFRPYWHQRVPPNDGGIALGQVMAVKCKI
jgi:hydrogenase maturation protein HypF